MSPEPLRAEHDAVLSSLSTRESTRHFAHGAVSLFLAAALGGTSSKLWADWAASHPQWWVTCAGLGVVILGYSLVRFRLGAQAHAQERLQLRRLRELRATLNLDAPAHIPSAHQ